jgi:hypothetical protein
MAVLRSVAKTDTFEIQRQKINLLAQDLYGYVSGQNTIPVLKTEYSDGSLTAPSLTFDSDTTLGIYKDGSQRLGFAGNSKPILSLSYQGSYFAQNFYAEKRSLDTTKINIVSGGQNYQQGSYTNIDIINGTGQSAKANITVNPSGSVSNVSIVEGGYGYVVGDILTVNPADISASPTGRVIDFDVVSSGFTYVDGIDIATSGGSGTGLTVDITTSINGVPTALSGLSGGSGYITSQNVATTGGDGSGLTLDIVADPLGLIDTANVTQVGSDYFAGTYGVTGGNGNGATFSITVVNDGGIDTATLTNAGTGYTAGVQTLSGASGTGGTINVTVSTPVVDGITVSYGGNDYTQGTYTNQPTFPLLTSGDGLTVNFTVDANGQVTTASIVSPGSGYAVSDIVYVEGSSTSDFATIEITSLTTGGIIQSISVVSSGTGYTTNQILNIDGGFGGQITVNTVLGGNISTATLQSAGQDYETGDVLTILGGTDGQVTVNGTLGGGITSATINTPGNSYTFNDLVTISGGNGDAQIAVTGITGGSITSISVNQEGSGYAVGDVITISGVNNPQDKASYEIIDTSDGQGFSFTSTGITSTTPIIGNVLTGDVEAVSFTGTSGLIDDLNSDTILSDEITASTNLTTPKITSTNILEFDVTNDINISSVQTNFLDNSIINVSIESSTGNITSSGTVKSLSGLNINDITSIVDNQIETLLDNPLILKPATNKNVKIDSNRALIVPVGTQVQRPQFDAETGAIRFNTDTRQFEGYDGDINVWSSLGSVRDTDGNTFLLAEATVGANDNTFYFFNNNLNTLQLTENELIFEGIQTINSTLGELNLSDTTLSFSENLKLSSNLIETQSSGLTIKPSPGTHILIDSTTSLVIPTGTTQQRGSATTGSIRFNTSNQQFEGYGFNAWSSLGGVRDVDGNTYIIPELSAGSNENILYFYNNGFNSLQLDQTKLEFRHANTISSIDLENVLQWLPATSYDEDDLVYNGINVYKIVTSLTSGGSGPTHTSGTENNYEFIRTIYGDLNITNVNNLNINSVVNINNKLVINNTDISSVTDHITFTPFTGKNVKVDSTTSFILPVGTSLNRGLPEAGAVRFNSDTTQYEGYNGTAWTSLGGVRDVDGNTYIIPESSSGENENILYFYNDGDNTLRVTKTSLTFQTANTITSNNNILNINVNDVRYSSDTFGINSSDSNTTKVYSGKNNLDIGLKSGLTNDALIRLSGTGDIFVNTTFTEGSYTPKKVLDRSLKYFGLNDVIIETNKFTLVKGTNNFNSYNLYHPNLSHGCKLTIIAVDLTTTDKHIVDYNIIESDGTIYNVEYKGLVSNNILYNAEFDFDPSGEVRVTTTLDNSVLSDTNVAFTILKTIIK